MRPVVSLSIRSFEFVPVRRLEFRERQFDLLRHDRVAALLRHNRLSRFDKRSFVVCPNFLSFFFFFLDDVFSLPLTD